MFAEETCVAGVFVVRVDDEFAQPSGTWSDMVALARSILADDRDRGAQG